MRSEIENKKQRKWIDHTFAICAYGECRYLEQCVNSLMKQSALSEVIMITSTPNKLIRSIAEKYSVPLFINKGDRGITQDWNFAISKVKTTYATIAHQDDVYEPEYSKTLYEQMISHEQPIIGFSDYYELHDDRKVMDSKLIKVKKMLLFPLKIKPFQNSRFIRRRSLSLGCSICCPSVMYCLNNIEQPIFNNRFTCCEDWEAWEKLSRIRGSFIYIPQPLMAHRIHKDATTTKTVNNTGRAAEDREMFLKFWPAWIAEILVKRYSEAEQYNK